MAGLPPDLVRRRSRPRAGSAAKRGEAPLSDDRLDPPFHDQDTAWRPMPGPDSLKHERFN